MTDHRPIQPELHNAMNELAYVLDAYFKPYGFALLVFPFGDTEDARMNYISNAPREDMLIAMKEFIAHNEARRLENKAMQ
jgi:hypothetical protein